MYMNGHVATNKGLRINTY